MKTEDTTIEEDGIQPAENDIILGRHKIATHHTGNLRLIAITNSYMEEYKQSTDDKTRKSQILAAIFDQIEQTKGRFLKLDPKEKRWREVTKSVARERISQGLRDGLKDYYKSSLSHKKKRRLVKNGTLAPDDPAFQVLPFPSSGENPSNHKRRKASETEDQKIAALPLNETNDKELSTDTALPPILTTGVHVTDSEDKRTKEGDPIGQPFLPKDGKELLAENFEPQNNDVVVGLRKRSATHPG